MPASSDRPETMTKAPSPDRRTPGGVVAAVTPPAHYFCGSGSAPSAHSGLRLCCLRATFTTLVPSAHPRAPHRQSVVICTGGRSAQGPRQRQAQRGTGRPHDHRGQEMSTMNRAVGSHDWHNHRSNYRGHRPDSVVATAVGRRSAVVHDAGRNHEPGVSPGVHTATATVKPRAVCTGTPDRPASRSRVRR